MKTNVLIVVTLGVLMAPTVKAEESKSPLKNESEAAVSISSGNSASETYLLKQKTSYAWDGNKVIADGNYQKAQSKDAGTGEFVESANNWKAGLRFERRLTERFDGFVAHSVARDEFAGYIQRLVYDLGGKYHIIKEGPTTWFAEAGYRNTFDYNTDNTGKGYSSLRVYSEANRKFSETLSGKLWAEYIPNISNDDDGGDDNKDYQANGEASIKAALSTIFSLKMAYLAKYDNRPNAAGAERLDTLYTASLLANW